MKSSRNFYQWDINQKFTECDGRFVDFVINEKDIYRVDIVNGECIIPDEFLQTSGYHTVYECTSDYTIQNHMFPVHPREKPPGYVCTPTEKLTFDGLVQKVNDTVADIIHRADSGEFDGYTPVKGKDYFTEAEKNEMVQSVSSGAVGEFRNVVDSATADFNENSSVKTNYYNSNAEQKLESYNSNHTAKVAEYNQNAETKTAEFDSNAAALQTEVDRLRGECDNLAEENRKQENRISALMKLNKGQTYDVLEQESEAYSVDVPSGSHYASIDMVGGHSEVIDGEIVSSQTDRLDIRGANIWDDEISKYNNNWTRKGNVYKSSKTDATYVYQDLELDVGIYTLSTELISFDNDRMKIHFRDLSGTILAKKDSIVNIGRHSLRCAISRKGIYRVLAGGESTGSLEISNIMLTKSSDSEYKPYSLQQIETDLPALNSAGSVYDYIDLNEGKLYTWTYIDGNEIKALTEPVITDIEIPTELTDWLTVEAGGSVTFQNADESKQLAVPNAVSWVRKLNEVE